MTKEQQYILAQKHARRMKLFERQHLKAVFNALNEQIKPVVSDLRNHGVQTAQKNLDTLHINSHLAPVVRDIYATVGLYFANKTIWDLRQEHKASFGFNEEFLREILAYFSRYLLNKVVLAISETTKQQILSIMSEGMQKGWGADKIAMMLESPELTLFRARMIVRTEANKAMNYGQILGESKSPWESQKIWISAHDARTRHSHNDVSGMTLDFKDRFMVPIYSTRKPYLQQGVDLMSGPGDQHASAGNVINCRCHIGFKAKRDENGRLIRKPNNSVILTQ